MHLSLVARPGGCDVHYWIWLSGIKAALRAATAGAPRWGPALRPKWLGAETRKTSNLHAMADRDTADSDRHRPENYWTLSTTAMTQAEAAAAARQLTDRLPNVDVDPVNPRHFMTWHMDVDTVCTVRDALAGAVQPGQDVGSLLEECDDWLKNVAKR